MKRADVPLLISRIRGEYIEMPGLASTTRQWCRLSRVDTGTCEMILKALTTLNLVVHRASAASSGRSARTFPEPDLTEYSSAAADPPFAVGWLSSGTVAALIAPQVDDRRKNRLWRVASLLQPFVRTWGSKEYRWLDDWGWR